MFERLIQRVKNSARSLLPVEYRYDKLPPEKVRAAMTIPWVRQHLQQFSFDEYYRNPYYASVVNKQSEQTIGPCPTMIATSDEADANDLMEDSHQEWTQHNMIGRSLRLYRRNASLTGLGLMIRHRAETTNPVKVGYKVYSALDLKTPWGTNITDRIIDGVEYNEDWEPIKFHFRHKDDMHFHTSLRVGKEDTIPFEASEVIWWSRGYESGRISPIPECYAAFTVYPYIRRYLQAVIESAEFRSSFPMALELDSNIYKGISEMKLSKLEKFEYQPRSVPTLPVGTKLQGLPQGASAENSERMLRTMAAACALTIDMPANLALGDSSDSNMASAQVDIQPWKNHVNIDRFDLIPSINRTFTDWYSRARLIRGITPALARTKEYETWFPHNYVYDPLFQHPDPLKNANARLIDLKSGASTLNRSYAELGRNARRDIEREAKLMGITPQQLNEHYLAARTNLSIQIIQGEMENVEQDI